MKMEFPRSSPKGPQYSIHTKGNNVDEAFDLVGKWNCLDITGGSIND